MSDELRVPPMPDPAKAERARTMVAAMKRERELAFQTLRTVGQNYVMEDAAKQGLFAAVFLLHAQIEALSEAFEIVVGKHEPSAAERSGQSS